MTCCEWQIQNGTLAKKAFVLRGQTRSGRPDNGRVLANFNSQLASIMFRNIANGPMEAGTVQYDDAWISRNCRYNSPNP